MAFSALKKRKWSSLLEDDGNEIYTPHAAVIVSNNSSTKESEHVQTDQPVCSNHTPIEARRFDKMSWSSSIYGSNMFKLKANELLAKVRPDYERHDVKLKRSLRRLEDIIERIPDRRRKTVLEAECELLGSHDLRIPFPEPWPTEHAKLTLAYSKPAKINVVGSYACKTAVSVEGRMWMDLAITMPSHIFQDKDYLNYRYFHKRAYYLACIASGIQEAHEDGFAVDFGHQNDNHLQPIIIVTPLQDDGSQSKTHIRIILAVDEDLFPIVKTLPDKNCIRSTADGFSSENLPTPFYNASLRSECSSLAYLKYLHASSSQSNGFSDACQLGCVWLRQRGLSREFGSFEWSCTMALLMEGGGPNGKPILSRGYDSCQLFKATLQYLVLRDLIASPAFVRSKTMTLIDHDGPVLFDGKRGVNILFKVTPWSYKILKHEASITLKLLNDPLSDQFNACFITKVNDLSRRFDWVMRMRTSQSPKPASQMADALDDRKYFCNRVYNALKRGLSDRITLLHIEPPRIPPWHVTEPQESTEVLHRQVQVGMLLHPINFSRTVDRGPSAEDKVAAAAFREFWGEKAELRRFKDGSIQESLIWSSSDPTDSVLKQILVYIVHRHLGRDVVDSIEIVGDSYDRLLPAQKSTANDPSACFRPVMDTFESLEKAVRGLEGLPLKIRQFSAADAQLRYSSHQVPGRPPFQVRIEPASICLEFEGSSRWPNDIAAVQRTKIAFLLKLGELLEESTKGLMTRLGFENSNQKCLNMAFLDVHYISGVSFRLRIHHERELHLLERFLKDPSHTAASRVETASALSTYKRVFIQGPLHTQAIRTLSTRFPLLSPTMRLMKKWRDSHMLSSHISDELVELLTVRTFVHPYPWSAPGSAITGLLRTLTFVSRWHWQTEPLIVDFSGEMSGAEIEAVHLRFDAWRKMDPAMDRISVFAASNLDPTGITWTEMGPPKVVATRFTSLAKAACNMLNEQGLSFKPQALFVASMEDYDFVIHLDPKSTGNNGRETRQLALKNLGLQSDQDKNLSSFDPVQLYLSELKAVYGSNILFFNNEHRGFLIAGLWNPQIRSRPWKIHLSYTTRPIMQLNDGAAEISINRAASLHDITRLGGDMVSRIEIKL